MENKFRFEIKSKNPTNELQYLKRQIGLMGYDAIDKLEIDTVRFFKVFFNHNNFSESFLNKLIENGAIHDSIIDDICFNEVSFKQNPFLNKLLSFDYFVEISLLPGVTDNTASTTKELFSLFKMESDVVSGKIYAFKVNDSNLNQSDILLIADELLANRLIQNIKIFTLNEFIDSDRFNIVNIDHVIVKEPSPYEIISVANMPDEDLLFLSSERCLALSLDELNHIKDYYKKDSVKSERLKVGLPEEPTDLEIEVCAQSWSEHCKHKIFAADIDYRESDDLDDELKKIGDMKISSLYKSFIKRATNDVVRKRKLDWAISVFSDNAGIVRFDSTLDYAIKVETHNSPSALDPYGGALTGILGVNRDILGCGMGAKPILNTDVFCFADPNKEWKDELPVGLKHPRRILEGVHKGVEDGGNKSGIPTVNGAFYFDDSYCGKPLVFVGTVGIMPQRLSSGKKSSTKEITPGDLVVMIGGEIGRDGIHGATFSSMDLNESSPTSAVQIGDPLTQKRVTDFLMEARDLELFSCVTDNGAGGLSSSIGEMSILSGGGTIDLKKCPVKYPGLTPYELIISESQERMSLAVPPALLNSFLELAKRRGVIATAIGEFTNSGYLDIYYGETLCGHLDLDFLHESLPKMNLIATWSGPKKNLNEVDRMVSFDKKRTNFNKELLRLLSSANITSKENWVRQYDHEVGGATVVKPFGGVEDIGPNDAGVIWSYPHGGDKFGGVAIGCGLNPKISEYDPYLMAQYAVDEAVRNVISVGGNIDFLCLLDNFCWPDPVRSKKTPDGDYKLGQLVRTCQGLYDICLAYGLPLVSGKDSMKNDFRGKKRDGKKITISVLPTLLVTAMGKVDIRNLVTSDFKKEGDLIYLLDGGFNDNLDRHRPYKLYKLMNQAYQSKIISSTHDISEGGMLVALAESSIGGNMGATIEIPNKDDLNSYLFEERPSRFIVSIKQKERSTFEDLFNSYFKLLGASGGSKLVVSLNSSTVVDVDVLDLKNAFKKGV